MPVDCAVCLSPYNFRAYPVVGRCGHSICQLCSSNLRSRNCPICRSRGAFTDPARNHRAYEMMQEVMIRKDADKVLLERLNRAQEDVRRTREIVNRMKAQYEPQDYMDTDSDNFSLDDEGARDMDPFDLIMPMGRGEVVRRQRPVGDGLVRIRRLPPAVHPRYQPTAHREWMPINQERRGRDQSRDIRPHIQNTQQWPGGANQPTPPNYGVPTYGQVNPPQFIPAGTWYQVVQPVQPAPVLPTYPFAVHQYNPRNLVPFPFYPPQQ